MTSFPSGLIPDGMDVRRAARRTGMLGIAYSVLVLISYALLTQAPGVGASDAEYAEFYSSSDRRLVIFAGLYVMPFAGIAFMWFVVMLRMWINRTASRVDQLFSNVQLVSGIVFLGLFLAAAAAMSVLAASAEFSDYTVDPQAAREFTQLGWALTVVFAMRMAGVFVLTTATLGRRHGFLPSWFVFIGYVVGLFLLLSAVLSSLLILVLPLWVLVLGFLLLARARAVPDGTVITRA